MSVGIECRYASLLAFLEARDTQLTLPLSGDNCGRESGRFAAGNTCAADSSSPSERQPRPRANPVTGGPRSNTSNGFPPAWRRPSSISHSGPMPGLPGVDRVTVDNPREVYENARAMGAQSVASLARLGAADIEGARVTLDSSGRPGSQSPLEVSISADIPVTPPSGGEMVGMATVKVSLRRQSVADDPYAYYDLFHRDSMVAAAISREKASSENGESPIERKLASLMFDRMLSSLEEAEKLNCSHAKTYAAGSANDSTFKGYRLWGRFGFDAPVPDFRKQQLLSDLGSTRYGGPILSPEHEDKLRTHGSLTLQELISTKPGERWWAQNGGSLNLTLDFRDKESPGYQRYKRLLDKSKRAKQSGQRAYMEFCEFAATHDLDESEHRSNSLALDCRIASIMAFAESRNCGTGSGGFQKGNTCAGGKLADAATGAAEGAIKGAVIATGVTGPFPPYVIKGAAVGAAVGAVKGLYDNSMQPTRVMKKIDDIGTSEAQVSSLVERLGGSPQSVASVKNGKLTLRVKNEKGERLFDVEMGESKYTITPARKAGTLTGSEIAQVKKIAEENSPKSVSVVVKSRSPSYVAKLVKKGFRITADAAGTLIATVVLPTSASVGVAIIEGAADHIKKKKT